jgi:hypothetical protein
VKHSHLNQNRTVADALNLTQLAAEATLGVVEKTQAVISLWHSAKNDNGDTHCCVHTAANSITGDLLAKPVA